MSELRVDRVSNTSSDAGVDVKAVQAVDEAYTNLGTYGAGILIESYHSKVVRDGISYRPLQSLVLPYTTTGVWGTEGAFFAGVGADKLKTELASTDPTKGAALVEFNRTEQATGTDSVNQALSSGAISVWEFVSLITSKPDPANPDTWDWTPAILAAYQAAYDHPVDPGNGLRWSKSVYFPAGIYLVNATIGPKRNGIATIGEGPLTSVIRPMAGMPGDWIFRAEHLDPSGNSGGCSMYNIGIDCANETIGGYHLSDGYDGVELENLRVSRVHANYVGFSVGPRTDGNPGTGVSQTIYAQNVFVYKNDSAAIVPPVVINKVQEAQFVGCKSWAGGYGGGAQAAVPAWDIVDCRSIDLIGCSAVGASDYGVKVRASTRIVSGIRIRGMLYENCTGKLRTTTTHFGNFPIIGLVHELARVEAPSAGGYDLAGLSGADVDIGTATATLQTETSQCRVAAQRQVNVTNNGTDNLVVSQPNSIDGYVGYNRQTRVVTTVAPRTAFGRPDTTDFGYLVWNTSSGSDLGMSLGVNRGSDLHVVTLDDTPASNTTAMTLLTNIGGVTTAKAVTIGAVDSGGAGFRVLRIPNT